MSFRFFVIVLFLTYLPVSLISQTEAFTVTRAPFSSDRYDELGPAYYMNGIVFSTNRKAGSLADYSDSRGRSSFSIYYIDTTQKVTWRSAVPFSKNLTTRLNDGPVSFNKSGDAIFYSRNLRVEGSVKDLSGASNKLGIFSALYTGKEWGNIREFRFNSEWYNISTPFLNSDGSRLYFASDKPGGFGGSDIYYSEWRNGYWDDPVNLGPEVNTSGNESYPFMNESGELFFASDGHPTMGGKDIFVTREKAGGWYKPIRLDAPLNSTADDFGLITDPTKNEGYFSSNRLKSVDIFHFRQEGFQFWFGESQKMNQYCIIISNAIDIQIDTLKLKYVWDFGDGVRMDGRTASHCFPGPGKYRINLELRDKVTNALFMHKQAYDIEVTDIRQPFIDAPRYALVGQTIELSSCKSFLPGYEITGSFWDFGDGARASGLEVDHAYTGVGEYTIQLGLTLRSQLSGEMSKRIVSSVIRVVRTEQEGVALLEKGKETVGGYPDLTENDNIRLTGSFPSEEDFAKEFVYRVVVRSSPSSLSLTNSVFRSIPSKYAIREYFDSGSGSYIYYIDQQVKLMSAWFAWNEVVSSGYRDAAVRLVTLQDQVERDLYNIIKKYELLTDICFDDNNRITARGNLLLDQIIALMGRHGNLRLEVGVHTDNQGSQASNVSISHFRAQLLVNYLVSNGVSAGRLVPKGYGGNRPVELNDYATGRRINRRIEFSIIN